MTHHSQTSTLAGILRGSWRSLLPLALIAIFVGCGGGQSSDPSDLPALDNDQGVDQGDEGDELVRPEGWSEESHSDEADPNCEVVFPTDKVQRFDITISSENWQAMLDDMTEMLGPFGQVANQAQQDAPQPDLPDTQQVLPDNQPPADGQPPQEALAACEGLEEGASCHFTINAQQLSGACAPVGDQLVCVPGGGGGQGPGVSSDRNPIYVPCTLEFQGQTWTSVGIRFKGFSSLRTSWQQGIGKLPLRLDMDEFEDDVPEIKNQRFYGFKRLSLANNFHDTSFSREKVAGDILRNAGVPAARSAFYRVYIDFGQGSQYMGLYTLVEVPDDPLTESQLGSTGGNIYKPDGQGADWTEFAEEGFAKKSNEEEADFSDIQAAIAALQADRHDAEAWRAGLEATFDVDGFLHWLAINTLMENWDAYGAIAHNYYLYGDPNDGGRLHWIPWDHNEALQVSDKAPSLELSEVSERWPLIRYLMDDEHYAEVYYGYLADALQGAFAPDKVEAELRAVHDLLEPYTVGAEGEQSGYTFLKSADEFDAQLDQIISHVNQRYTEAAQVLAARQ